MPILNNHFLLTFYQMFKLSLRKIHQYLLIKKLELETYHQVCLICWINSLKRLYLFKIIFFSMNFILSYQMVKKSFQIYHNCSYRHSNLVQNSIVQKKNFLRIQNSCYFISWKRSHLISDILYGFIKPQDLLWYNISIFSISLRLILKVIHLVTSYTSILLDCLIPSHTTSLLLYWKPWKSAVLS